MILFTVASRRKESKCPLTDKWIKNNVVIHYNLILLSHRKEEVLIHATTWIKTW